MRLRFRILRYFAYAVEIIAFFVIQQTPGLLPEVLYARPVLLLPIAFSIAMFEREGVAIGFGVFCGLLIDFGMGNGVLGFHGLLLAVSCFAISFLVGNLVKNNFITALLINLAGILLIFLLQWVFFYLLAGYDNAGYAYVVHYLPRVAYTFLLFPIFYYFNRAFAVFIRERDE